MYSREVKWQWSFAQKGEISSGCLPLTLPLILSVRHIECVSSQTFSPLVFDLSPSLHSPLLIHSSPDCSLSLSLIVSTRERIWTDVGGGGLFNRLSDVRIYAYMDFFKYTFQIRFSHSPLRAPRREREKEKKKHMIRESRRDSLSHPRSPCCNRLGKTEI